MTSALNHESGAADARRSAALRPGPVASASRRPVEDPSAAAPDGRAATAGGLPGAGVLAIMAVGLALGLCATALVLARGWDPGAVTVGAWTARPQVGTAAIDPYARAELARSGAVPLVAGEGLAFVATTDDTGYRLLRTCSYRVSGAFPPARVWTLTATDPDGSTLANPAERAAFTSNDVLRDMAGGVAVVVAPSARPGNWLPLTGDGPLTLTLRLYGTPLAGHSGEAAAAALPAIARLSCTGGAANADGGTAR